MPRAARVQMADSVEELDTVELLEKLTTPLEAARQPGTVPPSERPDQPPPDDPRRQAPEEEPEQDDPEPGVGPRDPAEQPPDEQPDEDDDEPGLPADPPHTANPSGDPAAQRLTEYQKNFMVLDQDPSADTIVFEGEMTITPPPKPNPDATRYVSRIEILEAWQYPGGLANAPDWIDRNWTAYSTDVDPLRNIAPGPCLKIPLATDPSSRALCRVGDYVALQQVQIDSGFADTRIEVWARENFQKLFMPRNP